MTESSDVKSESSVLPGALPADMEHLLKYIEEVTEEDEEPDGLNRTIEATGAGAKAATETGPLKPERVLTIEQAEVFLDILRFRFMRHMERHGGMEWAKIQSRLDANPEKIWSLNEMERTGGEPDVVGYDKKTGEYIFNDCSVECPSERRDIYYDNLGRKGEKLPEALPFVDNAVDMAEKMGVRILSAKEYVALQELGDFDVNSVSYLKTPSGFRGGDRVLAGHRGSDDICLDLISAYFHDAKRGFRASLRV